MAAPITNDTETVAAGHHHHDTIKCGVCDKVFAKILKNCPFCAGLSDEEIKKRVVVAEENGYFLKQMAVIITAMLAALALLAYSML